MFGLYFIKARVKLIMSKLIDLQAVAIFILSVNFLDAV